MKDTTLYDQPWVILDYLEDYGIIWLKGKI